MFWEGEHTHPINSYHAFLCSVEVLVRNKNTQHPPQLHSEQSTEMFLVISDENSNFYVTLAGVTGKLS